MEERVSRVGKRSYKPTNLLAAVWYSLFASTKGPTSVACSPIFKGVFRRNIFSMASSSTRPLAQKLATIATTWAKDPFRPNLQLSTFLNSLAAHPRLTRQAVEATRALRDNDVMKKVLYIHLLFFFSDSLPLLHSIHYPRGCWNPHLHRCITKDL